MKPTINTSARLLGFTPKSRNLQLSNNKAAITLVAVVLLLLTSACCWNSGPAPLQLSANFPLETSFNRNLSLVLASFTALLVVSLKFKGRYLQPPHTPTRTVALQPLPTEKSNGVPGFEINSRMEAAAHRRLQKFEDRLEFLAKDVSLSTLAALLRTNSKYAAALLLKTRGKNSIDYLNALKINYIMERLKTDPSYRSRTQKSLSEEAGFGVAKTFARVFKSHCGMNFTEFIAELPFANLTINNETILRHEQQS